MLCWPMPIGRPTQYLLASPFTSCPGSSMAGTWSSASAVSSVTLLYNDALLSPVTLMPCAVLEVKKVAALLTVQSTVDVLLRVVSVMAPVSTPGSGGTREGGLAANSGTGPARQEFGTGCGLSNRRVYVSKQRFVSAWIFSTMAMRIFSTDFWRCCAAMSETLEDKLWFSSFTLDSSLSIATIPELSVLNCWDEENEGDEEELGPSLHRKMALSDRRLSRWDASEDSFTAPPA
mmetsp:Transcript_22908/g.43791  ORF Transcript_22908/g.43791 Transcript_22908/m.43791 type:complete len:233 (+) Transcript_22908:56-754(+)